MQQKGDLLPIYSEESRRSVPKWLSQKLSGSFRIPIVSTFQFFHSQTIGLCPQAYLLTMTKRLPQLHISLPPQQYPHTGRENKSFGSFFKSVLHFSRSSQQTFSRVLVINIYNLIIPLKKIKSLLRGIELLLLD